jgi:hypothetical protein
MTSSAGLLAGKKISGKSDGAWNINWKKFQRI